MSTAVLLDVSTGLPVEEPIAVPTVLTLGVDGSSSLGEPAESGLDSARDFVDRVGDPAGVTSAQGVAMRAEDLVVTTLFVLLRDVAGPAGNVPATAAYPTGWTSEQVELLREAMNFIGLSDVSLTPDTPSLRSRAPKAEAAAAVGAALLAADAAAVDPSTDSFTAGASDAATVAAYAAVPPIAPVEATPTRTSGARRRTAFLVGAVVTSGLLLTAGIVGVVAQSNTPETPVPAIESAESANSTASGATTTQSTAGPVDFPTTAASTPTPVYTPESTELPPPAAPEPAPVVVDLPPVPTVDQPTEPSVSEAPETSEAPVTTTRRPGVSFPPCFPLGCAESP
ncbi:hypothetical protein GCM10007304_47750 [Rhodococcoides trifolii]|uniref:Uncharacterized protein n=2 Tax=Rhodococcoides trifolii TaxID=908250 RepID=A0A917G8H5_9NOCA|nr:hypothetical protein GCM10007304_47750 [Rhodococcus trifolii]